MSSAVALLRRAKAANRAHLGYVPFPLHAKQRAFMALDNYKEALFGGAAGSGKTEVNLADSLRFTGRSHYSALILRRTYPELAMRGSIMQRALEWTADSDAHWDGNNHRLTFPSGAIIQFGYCDSLRDLGRYKSAQFHRIYIEELTEWPEDWYRFFFSRLRRVIGDTIPIGMRATTNPDGDGAEWVRERFDIPVDEIVKEPIINEGRSRYFLPASCEDNPSLDLAEYEFTLRETAGARYEQLRYGKWSRAGEGLVYRWNPSRNGLAALPNDFIGYGLALDYGYRDETAFCIVGWRRYSKVVYIVECFKVEQCTPTMAAEKVAELERKYHFQWIVGDIGGLGKGYQVEAVSRFHLPIEAAEKNNKMGYIKLLNGDLVGSEYPLVLINTPLCGELIREWERLSWAPNKIGKLENQGQANHCADAALYGWRRCFAYLAEIEGNETDIEREEREMFERHMKQEAAKSLQEELGLT